MEQWLTVFFSGNYTASHVHMDGGGLHSIPCIHGEWWLTQHPTCTWRVVAYTAHMYICRVVTWFCSLQAQIVSLGAKASRTQFDGCKEKIFSKRGGEKHTRSDITSGKKNDIACV